jgi:hypothetical protein
VPLLLASVDVHDRWWERTVSDYCVGTPCCKFARNGALTVE